METMNLRAELNALQGLDGRKPETPDRDLNPAFGRTIPYRDGYISTIKFSGKSAWEKHNGDELVFVAGGHGFLLLLGDQRRITPQSLSPGIIVIIPANKWHQIESQSGIALWAVTPQPTVHTHSEELPE